VLRYCEGLKLREVADVLEIPETTVSSRVAVGLAQITRLLEAQFDEIKGKAS
jgi:DNA-directed RNA polymerase specialized sigma24 family protein